MTNEELLYNIHLWEKEKMDALVEHNMKEDARRTGHQEGLEQGKKEGLEQGREKEKTEMIKNMLGKNTDYEYISEITGKTIEEIKEIEKSIK